MMFSNKKSTFSRVNDEVLKEQEYLENVINQQKERKPKFSELQKQQVGQYKAYDYFNNGFSDGEKVSFEQTVGIMNNLYSKYSPFYDNYDPYDDIMGLDKLHKTLKPLGYTDEQIYEKYSIDKDRIYKENLTRSDMNRDGNDLSGNAIPDRMNTNYATSPTGIAVSNYSGIYDFFDPNRKNADGTINDTEEFTTKNLNYYLDTNVPQVGVAVEDNIDVRNNSDLESEKSNFYDNLNKTEPTPQTLPATTGDILAKRSEQSQQELQVIKQSADEITKRYQDNKALKPSSYDLAGEVLNSESYKKYAQETGKNISDSLFGRMSVIGIMTQSKVQDFITDVTNSQVGNTIKNSSYYQNQFVLPQAQVSYDPRTSTVHNSKTNETFGVDVSGVSVEAQDAMVQKEIIKQQRANREGFLGGVTNVVESSLGAVFNLLNFTTALTVAATAESIPGLENITTMSQMISGGQSYNEAKNKIQTGRYKYFEDFIKTGGLSHDLWNLRFPTEELKSYGTSVDPKTGTVKSEPFSYGNLSQNFAATLAQEGVFDLTTWVSGPKISTITKNLSKGYKFTKAYMFGDKVSDVVKGVDKASDAAKTAEKAFEGVRHTDTHEMVNDINRLAKDLNKTTDEVIDGIAKGEVRTSWDVEFNKNLDKPTDIKSFKEDVKSYSKILDDNELYKNTDQVIYNRKTYDDVYDETVSGFIQKNIDDFNTKPVKTRDGIEFNTKAIDKDSVIRLDKGIPITKVAMQKAAKLASGVPELKQILPELERIEAIKQLVPKNMDITPELIRDISKSKFGNVIDKTSPSVNVDDIKQMFKSTFEIDDAQIENIAPFIEELAEIPYNDLLEGANKYTNGLASKNLNVMSKYVKEADVTEDLLDDLLVMHGNATINNPIKPDTRKVFNKLSDTSIEHQALTNEFKRHSIGVNSTMTADRALMSTYELKAMDAGVLPHLENVTVLRNSAEDLQNSITAGNFMDQLTIPSEAKNIKIEPKKLKSNKAKLSEEDLLDEVNDNFLKGEDGTKSKGNAVGYKPTMLDRVITRNDNVVNSVNEVNKYLKAKGYELELPIKQFDDKINGASTPYHVVDFKTYRNQLDNLKNNLDKLDLENVKAGTYTGNGETTFNSLMSELGDHFNENIAPNTFINSNTPGNVNHATTVNYANTNTLTNKLVDQTMTIPRSELDNFKKDLDKILKDKNYKLDYRTDKFSSDTNLINFKSDLTYDANKINDVYNKLIKYDNVKTINSKTGTVYSLNDSKFLADNGRAYFEQKYVDSALKQFNSVQLPSGTIMVDATPTKVKGVQDLFEFKLNPQLTAEDLDFIKSEGTLPLFNDTKVSSTKGRPKAGTSVELTNKNRTMSKINNVNDFLSGEAPTLIIDKRTAPKVKKLLDSLPEEFDAIYDTKVMGNNVEFTRTGSFKLKEDLDQPILDLINDYKSKSPNNIQRVSEPQSFNKIVDNLLYGEKQAVESVTDLGEDVSRGTKSGAHTWYTDKPLTERDIASINRNKGISVESVGQGDFFRNTIRLNPDVQVATKRKYIDVAQKDIKRLLHNGERGVLPLYDPDSEIGSMFAKQLATSEGELRKVFGAEYDDLLKTHTSMSINQTGLVDNLLKEVLKDDVLFKATNSSKILEARQVLRGKLGAKAGSYSDHATPLVASNEFLGYNLKNKKLGSTTSVATSSDPTAASREIYAKAFKLTSKAKSRGDVSALNHLTEMETGIKNAYITKPTEYSKKAYDMVLREQMVEFMGSNLDKIITGGLEGNVVGNWASPLKNIARVSENVEAIKQAKGNIFKLKDNLTVGTDVKYLPKIELEQALNRTFGKEHGTDIMDNINRKFPNSNTYTMSQIDYNNLQSTTKLFDLFTDKTKLGEFYDGTLALAKQTTLSGGAFNAKGLLGLPVIQWALPGGTMKNTFESLGDVLNCNRNFFKELKSSADMRDVFAKAARIDDIDARFTFVNNADLPASQRKLLSDQLLNDALQATSNHDYVDRINVATKDGAKRYKRSIMETPVRPSAANVVAKFTYEKMPGRSGELILPNFDFFSNSATARARILANDSELLKRVAKQRDVAVDMNSTRDRLRASMAIAEREIGIGEGDNLTKSGIRGGVTRSIMFPTFLLRSLPVMTSIMLGSPEGLYKTAKLINTLDKTKRAAGMDQYAVVNQNASQRMAVALGLPFLPADQVTSVNYMNPLDMYSTSDNVAMAGNPLQYMFDSLNPLIKGATEIGAGFQDLTTYGKIQAKSGMTPLSQFKTSMALGDGAGAAFSMFNYVASMFGPLGTIPMKTSNYLKGMNPYGKVTVEPGTTEAELQFRNLMQKDLGLDTLAKPDIDNVPILGSIFNTKKKSTGIGADVSSFMNDQIYSKQLEQMILSDETTGKAMKEMLYKIKGTSDIIQIEEQLDILYKENPNMSSAQRDRFRSAATYEQNKIKKQQDKYMKKNPGVNLNPFE